MGTTKTTSNSETENTDLSLSEVLDALSDPVRRDIVLRLSAEACLCRSFADLGTKSNLSYHFARLRTAGLTNTQKQGTCRLISLRKEEVNRAFPGLLTSILRGTEAERQMEKEAPRKVKPKRPKTNNKQNKLDV